MPNLAQPKLWTDHSELMIVKGVYPVPKDLNTIEPRIDSINLLDEKSGVSLAPDGGWTPQYPSLEGSGVWADTPLMVGRTPLVLTEGNVIEKMRLNINGSTHQMLANKAKFSLFMRYARDFWTEQYQIDPVYIQWFASCGGGRQYALIYNMELDWDDKDSTAPTSVLTLTIEREPYWRWIPPGANPEWWYHEWNNQTFDASTIDKTLVTSSNSGVGYVPSPSPLTNKSEFSSDCTTLVTDNAITIAANQIPGDAPALVTIITNNGNSAHSNFIIGKKTTKINVRSNSQTSQAQNTIINCNDGTLGTDATRVNDTGASKAIGAGTAQRVEISFATATNQLRWRASYSDANHPLNDMNRFLGRWMVFLRCRQSAGSTGDITMYLRYGTQQVQSDSDGMKLNIVNPIVTTGGTGNSTEWAMVYMGVVTIPIFSAKAEVNQAGNTTGTTANGLDNKLTAAGTIDFGLFAARTAGAGLLYINDLVLIPIDEGSITLETADNTASPIFFYDETGYFSRGMVDPFCLNGTPAFAYGLAKFTGTGIQLTPGVENRLYVINYFGTDVRSQVSDTPSFQLLLVPRSRGIRDRTNLFN